MEQQSTRAMIVSSIHSGLDELITSAEQLAPIIGHLSQGPSELRVEMRVTVDADKTYAKLPTSYSAWLNDGEWFHNENEMDRAWEESRA